MRRIIVLATLIAAASVAVQPASHASAAQLITNGDFDYGNAPWVGTRYGSPHNFISTVDHHSGRHSAQLCGINSCYDQLTHPFTLPTSVGQATLSYWVHVVTPGATSAACGDALTVQLKAPNGNGFVSSVVCGGPATGWVPKTENVTTALQPYLGQHLQLQITGRTDTSEPTTFFVDDVRLQVTPASGPPPPVTQISSDPFTAPVTGQHRTEVEPDSFTYGNTTVSAFQIGRISDGGSTAIGWATNSNGSWSNGLLPGITTSQSPAGPYDRATDAAVVYDASHHVWLANSLGLTARNGDIRGAAVLVNRSANGLIWDTPISVAATTSGDFDKNWITCDNTSTSPYFGHCYVEWDNYGDNDANLMSTSKDGGLTWSAPVAPATGPTGLGGQPLVQPNGTVLVPYASADEGTILVLSSTDGGSSWTAPVQISGINPHPPAASIRAAPLPTAAMDATGKIYVVWADCRFESSCAENDLVMTTSTNGVSWSPLMRIPTNTANSGQDSFIPGLAVNPVTSGSTAQLALTYYYYPNGSCSPSTCKLDVGFVSSTNAGFTWSAPLQLAGPMSLSWLSATDQGAMVGDYISTSFLGSAAVSVFADASIVGTVHSEWIGSTSVTVTGGHALAIPVAARTGSNDTSGVIADARPKKQSR